MQTIYHYLRFALVKSLSILGLPLKKRHHVCMVMEGMACLICYFKLLIVQLTALDNLFPSRFYSAFDVGDI